MRRMFLMEYMYDNRLREAAQPKPLSNRVERYVLLSFHKNVTKKLDKGECEVGMHEDA